MTFPCFVLGKGSSSYAFIDSHQAEDDAAVGDIARAAQNLASLYHKWELKDTVGIELYQVLSNSPLHCPF